MRGIHRWPVNSPHKGPVTRKMYPFDDVIMARCEIFAGISFNSFYVLISWALPLRLVWGECRGIPLITSQHCLQATSHYLSHCWSRYKSSYETTWPQWFKQTLCVKQDTSVSLINVTWHCRKPFTGNNTTAFKRQLCSEINFRGLQLIIIPRE